MFKDPNVLALFAYLAGHAVHYLLSRPLRIPAAAIAKTPALATVNTLEDVLAPAAEDAMNKAIMKKLGVAVPASVPAGPDPAPIIRN